MEPNHTTPYSIPQDSSKKIGDFPIETRQFYGNPFYIVPPPIIPIIPFPPFFFRFPHRRRFFW